MKKLAVLCSILWAVLPCAASAATVLVAPNPTAEAAARFDVTRVRLRYDLPADRIYVTRTIAAVSGSYESFYGSLGYVGEADFDDVGDGSRALQPLGDPGFMLAVGARGAAWRAGEFALNVDFQFHVLNEKVESGGARYAMQSFEVLAGAAAAWEPPGWRAWAGIDTVPYSFIDMDLPGFEEMERSDFIILHAGGGMDLGPVFLDADVQFVGAEGFRVGLGYAFCAVTRLEGASGKGG